MGDKRKIIVRLTRHFSYPYAMLDKSRPMQDAMVKLDQDLVTEMSEHLKNDPEHFRERFFETEVVEELPFKFRTPPIRRDERRLAMSFNTLLRALVKHKMEEIYGSLEPEKNPKLFDVTPAITNERGEVLEEAHFYMKREIEQVYNEKEEMYANFLHQIENM